jgi:hypothetical protein
MLNRCPDCHLPYIARFACQCPLPEWERELLNPEPNGLGMSKTVGDLSVRTGVDRDAWVGDASMVEVMAGDKRVSITVSGGRLIVEISEGDDDRDVISTINVRTSQPTMTSDEALDLLRRKLAE